MTKTYTIHSDRLTATFDPDGARMRSLQLDGGPNLILDVDDAVTPALRDAYGGTIVGPLANRVRGGKVPMGNVIHQMPCNEVGITALHSGPDGLDRMQWTVTGQHPARLCLQYHLPDGHGGLPGNRVIDLEYSVWRSTLTVNIWMQTDAPTPASIAHHPYWRVTGGHSLRIHADQYLPTDNTNLPTGDIADVAGTPFDHRTPRAIDKDTDHNFCVSTTRAPDPRPMAELTTAHSRLKIDSTEPGLQAYSGAFLPDIPQAEIAPLSGIALEPQGWPDAVNNAHFPNVICAPDHRYSQTTRYTLNSAT
ncbi:galactose mutarotase [Tateyamaria omphalii]|uniref:aldose epimerase family protein n=1 Tax=Tateyamaria omphalii TaxID=299262 RepID=UPI001C990E1E|nr:galactose mutarotase [Tateyamaria omphalii]MBY5932745.1 galactose mutarotase [Tateyamaria omphalii]